VIHAQSTTTGENLPCRTNCARFSGEMSLPIVEASTAIPREAAFLSFEVSAVAKRDINEKITVKQRDHRVIFIFDLMIIILNKTGNRPI
jgi:hypothetical protein